MPNLGLEHGLFQSKETLKLKDVMKKPQKNDEMRSCGAAEE